VKSRRRPELKQLDARVLQQDAEKLTLPDRSFDVVWTWGVTHSSSTEQCVSEISRVLRLGGRLMMMVGLLSPQPRVLSALRTHPRCLPGATPAPLPAQNLCKCDRRFLRARFFKVRTAGNARVAISLLHVTVVGLKAELYPIPRNSLKIVLERVTPDWLARAVMGKFGSMVVVEAIRS